MGARSSLKPRPVGSPLALSGKSSERSVEQLLPPLATHLQFQDPATPCNHLLILAARPRLLPSTQPSPFSSRSLRDPAGKSYPPWQHLHQLKPSCNLQPMIFFLSRCIRSAAAFLEASDLCTRASPDTADKRSIRTVGFKHITHKRRRPVQVGGGFQGQVQQTRGKGALPRARSSIGARRNTARTPPCALPGVPKSARTPSFSRRSPAAVASTIETGGCWSAEAADFIRHSLLGRAEADSRIVSTAS